MMTVKELKAKIADLPDEMIVVTDAPDHHYREVDAYVVEASRWPNREMTEYHGDEHMDIKHGERYMGKVLSII